MNYFKDGYFNYALEHIPRLLSLMDRDFFSPTFGCFDRNFWHFKTKDFPCASNQMGVQSLAIIYSKEDSPFYQSPYLLKLIEAAISYTRKIQKSDGSFDEWYVNERGWAGPTGYLVHSLCRVHQLSNKELSEDSRKELILIIRKGAHNLTKSYEKQIITNHIAIALTALYESYHILDDQFLKEKYLELKKMMLANHTSEGWSYEYGFADVGYQSASVSFITFIHSNNKDPEIEEYSLSSLKFISNFILPNGSLTNSVSSRYTITLFFLAFEYWKDKSFEAREISKLIKENNSGPLLHQHEDHYFIYRILELLEASLFENRSTIKGDYELPSSSKKEFEKSFKQAGIKIYSNPNRYIVLNTFKGGSIHIWDHNKQLEIIDQGIVLKTKNKVLNSDSNNKGNEIDINEDEISIKGNFKSVPLKYFTPFKQILFRIFMICFGFSPKLASFLKGIIKDWLITPSGKTNYNFNRTILISDNLMITVKNSIDFKNNFTGVIYSNGFYYTRYVPQSKYFRSHDLQNFIKNIDHIKSSQSFKNEYKL